MPLVGRLARDDVDDATHGVFAVDGALGAAQDFNALDVHEGSVEIEEGVHRHAVKIHDKGACRCASRRSDAAHGHEVCSTSELAEIHVGDALQHLFDGIDICILKLSAGHDSDG